MSEVEGGEGGSSLMDAVFKKGFNYFLLFITSSVTVFSFFFVPNLPYSRPPLPQIEPREKRRGAVGCKRVLTFLLLPAGVTVGASARWMLRRPH